MSRYRIIAVALGQLLLAPVSVAAPSSDLDACLAKLRTGPDSFLDYLCLGTPGLPDRAAEVEEILKGTLKRTPGEPHARLYLALMRLYRRESVPIEEFTTPLAEFERRRAWVDTFLAQLAFVERMCLGAADNCVDAEPIMRKANQLALTLKDPGLVRLAAIARIRWSLQTGTASEGRIAEQELDKLSGTPPPWLQVLEMNTRVVFGLVLGEHLRVRDFYRRLVAMTPEGSVAHGAALAGVAGATARLALQGLASRDEAVKLLRESIATQKQLHMANHNGADVGVVKSSVLLALLLGPTPEAFTLLEADRTGIGGLLRIEFLLQGSEVDRARALELARELTRPNELAYSGDMLARSHTEFLLGSRSEAIEWGKRAVERAGTLRRSESDEALRAGGDWSWANLYKTFVSDLLDTGARSPEDVALAFQVSEQLRAQLLLEALMARERDASIAPIPDVKQLQSALRPTEALVSFLAWLPEPTLGNPFTSGHSWALVVTRDRITAVRFGEGRALEAAVRAWTRLVDTREDTFGAGAQRLYGEVLKPVVDVLPPEVSSLIVVPDGPLHRLPFDALQEPASRRFAAEHFSISIVPSAAVWLRIRHRTPIPAGTVLAFANTPDGPAVQVAETRGEVEPGRLPPLRYAREEAEDAIAAFPGRGRLFVGGEATPARLSSTELSRASLVHFAAHGVVDRRQPEGSFLLLAPASSGNSGRLTMQDIRRLDWSGKTVVLSACDTSVGPVHLGEGVLSLARAFFAGGASAVLGTLAEVRDDEQRDLFRAFYAELRGGASVEDALHRAKQRLIRTGAPPASWANVILLGDGRIVPRAPDPGWRRSPVLVGAFMAAGLALLVLGVRTRRRKGASSE